MDPASTSLSSTPARGTRDPWFWVALLAVLAIYGTRLTELPICGEESRWATTAREMLRTGDFVVPRQQGEPWPDRPPMLPWLMAVLMLLFGEASMWAVRLPSLLAMVLTAAVAYGSASRLCGILAGFVAALAYPTMALVLPLGGIAECEAVFAGFLGSSLLLWEIGYSSGKSWAWVLGYALAAGAALTKGPQAPVYFIGSTWTYLVFRRDWRSLVSPSHALGLATFAMLVGAWWWLFWSQTDTETAIRIWVGQSAIRYQSDRSELLQHVLLFPLHILVGFLPWTGWLLLFLVPTVRRELTPIKARLGFLFLALAVGFLPLWIAAHARPRYYLPLAPVAAVLIGVSVDAPYGRGRWQFFARVVAILLPILAIFISIRDFLRHDSLAVSTCILAGIVAAAGVGVWATAPSIPSVGNHNWRWSILGCALIVGMVFTGVLGNYTLHKAEQTGYAVDQLREKLPTGTQLVSFGRTHHIFAWHYRDPIPVRRLTEDGNYGDIQFFCFERELFENTRWPFRWEVVAEISCEREQDPSPRQVVVVGRRVQ